MLKMHIFAVLCAILISGCAAQSDFTHYAYALGSNGESIADYD